jgi:hypothetical protein
MRARPLPLLALWLVACGSSAAPGLDAAPDVGGADAAEAGASEGGVPPDDETDISGRPSRGTYQCRIQRDRTAHQPRNWNLVPPALVTTVGGAAFLARFESTIPSLPPSPIDRPATQLLVSTFDVAGTFGTPVTVPVGNTMEVGMVTAAPRGDGFLIVWVESSTLRLAAFDGAGRIVLGPKDLVSSIPASTDTHFAGTDPRLAAGPDGGFGLIYTPQVALGSYEVHFTVLDPDGTLRMPPRPLTQAPGDTFAAPAPAILATSGGYAMIWRDPTAPAGGIDFAAVDARGAEVVARHRISPPVAEGRVVGGVSFFEAATNALVRIGDGFVAAWTESRPGTFPGGLHDGGSVVRLARLDGSGNRIGAPVSLRAFQADVDEVEPALVPFGDTLGLLWGHGSHIYACSGCVPDHRIDLLLLDPATLTPVSNLLSLNNGGDPKAGGLLRRRVAVLGDSLLTTYLLTFHTYATPGSAVFTCTKN